MQEEIRASQQFLERTNALSVRVGISLRSLAPFIGMSEASLFGYRNGKIEVSKRAWSLLELAEAKASSSVASDQITTAQISSTNGQPVVDPGAPPVTDMASLMVAMNRRLDQIGEAITRMAGVLENADLRPRTTEETVVRYWGCLGEAPAKDSRADSRANIKVRGQWPAHYFAVRVSGHHLAPDFPDQSLVMVRPLRAGEDSDNLLTCGDMRIPGIAVALAWEVL